MPEAPWEIALIAAAVLLIAIWLKNNQARTPKSFDQIQAPAASVEELVKAGKKLQAIKQLREQTGMGLAEAKAQVEAMGQGGQPSVSPEALQTEVDQLIHEGQTIHAVKAVRTQTGMGLQEAKEWVEKRARELGSGQ